MSSPTVAEVYAQHVCSNTACVQQLHAVYRLYATATAEAATAEATIRKLQTQNRALLAAKDAEILKLKQQLATSDAERRTLLVAAPTPRLTAPVQGKGTARLRVSWFEVHDNAAIHRHEPPVSCITADKPIQVVLRLEDEDKNLVKPPQDFVVCAELVFDGGLQRVEHEMVNWSGRGAANTRHVPLLTVNNSEQNAVRMDKSEIELWLKIGVYSSEVQKRKLAVRFSSRDPSAGVNNALSIGVNVMSRTPNSRKRKEPPASLPIVIVPNDAVTIVPVANAD